MSDRTSLKELQIKTGIVKRYIQEYKCYEKEANKLQDKVQQLKQESADNYDIKVCIVISFIVYTIKIFHV